MKHIAAGALLLLPLAGHCDAIYLCQDKDGENFWSQAHCYRSSGFVERVVDVPTGLSFEQQVKVASTLSPADECAAMDGRITHLDARARQPLSAGP